VSRTYKARVRGVDVFAQAGNYSDFSVPITIEALGEDDLTDDIFQVTASDSDANSASTLRTLWDRVYASGGVTYTVGSGAEKYIEYAFPVEVHLYSQVKIWVSGACNVYFATKKRHDGAWGYYYNPTGGGDWDDGVLQWTDTQATAQASPWTLSSGKNSARLTTQRLYRYWRVYIQGSVTVTIYEWRPWMLVAGDEIRGDVLASVNYDAAGFVGTYFNLDDGKFKIGDGSQWGLEWDGSTLTVQGNITVTGTDTASIVVGTGTKDSDLEGWHIGAAEIVGQDGDGADQVVFNTDGEITAGAGALPLNAGGISIEYGPGDPNSIKFMDGVTKVGEINVLYDAAYFLSITDCDGVRIHCDVDMAVAASRLNVGENVHAEGDIRVQGGLVVGNLGIDPDPDDIYYDGNLKSRKNSTNYDVYAFHPLTVPLTSTSWDGDAQAAQTTQIDLSSVFSAPADIKAVAIRIAAVDETPNVTFSVGPTTTWYYAVSQRTQVATYQIIAAGVCPCDGGDIYFYCSDELDNVWIEIYGYWI